MKTFVLHILIIGYHFGQIIDGVIGVATLGFVKTNVALTIAKKVARYRRKTLLVELTNLN